MPAIDTFKDYATGLTTPLVSAVPVTPSTTTDLAHVSRALFVGVGGDLQVVMFDGQTVTFSGLASGWHPIRVRRIIATGTTATDIVACR